MLRRRNQATTHTRRGRLKCLRRGSNAATRTMSYTGSSHFLVEMPAQGLECCDEVEFDAALAAAMAGLKCLRRGSNAAT